MTALKRSLPAVALLALALPVLADDVSRLPSWHAKAYHLILPTEAETKWQRIPWLTDLDRAVKQGKDEKRPLLVWTTGDDPLERC